MKKSLFTLSSFLFIGATLFGQSLPVSQTQGYKTVVLEELTGIKCVYCPAGHKIANEIAEANPGKVILVNIHAGGYADATPDYRTTAGNAINSFFAPDGYPTGSVQRTAVAGELWADRGQWQGLVDNILSDQAAANVAMSAEIDYTTRVLTVKVEVFYTQAQAAGTKHFLNVGILQDGLASQQTGANLNPSAILPDGKYEHKHMFRGFVNTGGIWGDQIDADQSGVITKEYQFTLPESINSNDLDMNNLKFYSILHNGKQTTTTSQILTGAQVDPTYINVPAGEISLITVMNELNVGCDDWTSIQPQVKLQNNGLTISRMKFEYTVNGQSKGQFEFVETVEALSTKTITLPILEYFTTPNAEIGIKLLSVDNQATGVGAADYVSTIVKSAVLLSDPNITLEVLTDNYPGETSGRFFKESYGNSILDFGPYAGNGNNAGGLDALKAKAHDIVLTETGCYSLRLKDSYSDGMQYGTNPNGGFGYRIRQGGNVIVEDVKPSFDFGSFKDYIGLVKLSILNTTNLDNEIGLAIYPNPTSNTATLQLSLTTEANVKYEVVNMLGQVLQSHSVNNAVGNIQETLNTSDLSAGQYLVNVYVNDNKTQNTLTIVK